jgi:peptide/nickel transport system substrate-binding protein
MYRLTRRQLLQQLGIATAGGVLMSCAAPVGAPSATTGGEAAVPAAPGASAGEVAPGIPRAETLILEDPTGRNVPPEDFNRWRAPAPQTWSNGFQQLALDALWYIDPDAGIDGVWDNSAAAEKPIYNEDFSQMTVKLRQGLYWSDGVEFTADDLIYTIQVQKDNPGFGYNGQFARYVESLEKVDDYTVTINLTEPNSRFHAPFTVRWAACFMMPKHIFEQADDPVAFTFYPPVSLGPYVLKDNDPNGDWYIWERREDWERTSLGRFGMPAPKYVMYLSPGPSDKKVIAQTAGDLDVIHDMAPEGQITLAKTNPTSRAWFPSFPWAHPDPTLPAVIYNHEKPGLDNSDVRWALTLAIDIVRVAMASYRGAATISAIHVPPTGMYPKYYFEPMQDWLNAFELDLGGGEMYAPYDPDAAIKIADTARESLGDLVPTDPAEIKKYTGLGWWKHDLDAAEKLMLKAGFSRNGDGKWLLPNGDLFSVPLVGESDTRAVMGRGASMIVENWQEFGIDTMLDTRSNVSQNVIHSLGDFTGMFYWNIETWGGHPDLFYFLQSWHSDLYRPSGEPAVGKNTMRWKNPELDRIIEEIQKIDFDDPKGIDLGIEFLKLTTQEMPTTPIMAYNVFTCCDWRYWEGFPTSDDPYTNPVPNWANSKYMFVKIKPKQA